MRYYGLGFEADTSTKTLTAGVKWDRRVLIAEFSYRDVSAVTANKLSKGKRVE
jgi:hypothetical protein